MPHSTTYAIILVTLAFVAIFLIMYSQPSSSIFNTEDHIDTDIKSHINKSNGLDIIENLAQKNDPIIANKSISDNTSLNSMYPYDANPSHSSFMLPHWEGDFLITMPSSVLVNETFDLEYTWTKRINSISERYLPLCDTARDGYFCSMSSDMDNIAILVYTNLKFVNTSKISTDTKCFIAITDNIDALSENKYDRSGKFTLKFTEIPNPNRHPMSIALTSVYHTWLLINATDNGNDIINLTVFGSNNYSNLESDFCSITDHLQGSNSPNANQTVPEISTIDLKPDCIDNRLWSGISEKDRNNILNNSTTCQIINGEQITNLPPIGYQLMPKVAFEELELFICHNYGTDLEAMILDGGFTDPVWIEDFTSNFDNLTEQSCKTMLEDYYE